MGSSCTIHAPAEILKRAETVAITGFDGKLSRRQELLELIVREYRWSVINYMCDLRASIKAFPRPYWINTSSNDIIKDMIARADRETKGQIETLLEGGTLDIQVHEEVTYGDMHSSGENLWNFLYFTGYPEWAVVSDHQFL